LLASSPFLFGDQEKKGLFCRKPSWVFLEALFSEILKKKNRAANKNRGIRRKQNKTTF